MAHAVEITLGTGNKVSLNCQSQEVSVSITYQLEREDTDVLQVVEEKATEVAQAHQKAWEALRDAKVGSKAQGRPDAKGETEAKEKTGMKNKADDKRKPESQVSAALNSPQHDAEEVRTGKMGEEKIGLAAQNGLAQQDGFHLSGQSIRDVASNDAPKSSEVTYAPSDPFEDNPAQKSETQARPQRDDESRGDEKLSDEELNNETKNREDKEPEDKKSDDKASEAQLRTLLLLGHQLGLTPAAFHARLHEILESEDEVSEAKQWEAKQWDGMALETLTASQATRLILALTKQRRDRFQEEKDKEKT
jgi:hypothetical protein